MFGKWKKKKERKRERKNVRKKKEKLESIFGNNQQQIVCTGRTSELKQRTLTAQLKFRIVSSQCLFVFVFWAMLPDLNEMK